MAFPLAAIAAPLVAQGVSALFRRRSSQPDPTAGYRTSLQESASAASREAADYRQQDASRLGELRKRLTGYQQRVSNPQTYRPQYDAAYGQGAAAGAFDAAHARAQVAAGNPGYETSTTAGANIGVSDAQLGNLAQLRARLMQDQMHQQLAGEREALDLEQQYENQIYGRAQDAQERQLAILRALLGDTTDTARYNAARSSANADRNAGLLGTLAQAWATYKGGRR